MKTQLKDNEVGAVVYLINIDRVLMKGTLSITL